MTTLIRILIFVAALALLVFLFWIGFFVFIAVIAVGLVLAVVRALTPKSGSVEQSQSKPPEGRIIEGEYEKKDD